MFVLNVQSPHADCLLSMWVLARFGFAALVFLFRALWRRQGVDESVLYRDTRRVTLAKYTSTGARGNEQRVISKIHWGLAFKTPLVFTLTRERWWDRVCKFLGVATELQTGDEGFDRKIYVAGDHPALHQLLAGDARLRERIVGLFVRGAVRIFSDGRHLWVEWTEPAYPSDRNLDELHGVYVALKDVGPLRGHWLLDSFLWKAIAVEALVWSVALYGAPAYVETLYREYVRGEGQRYPDLWALARPGLALAGAAFVGIFGLIVLFLRGSSRGHRILVESFAVLAIGLPLSAMEVVSDYNLSRTSSAPREFEYRVVAKWDTERQMRTLNEVMRLQSYYLWLTPISNGAPVVRPFLRVTASVYAGAKKGGTMRITVQSGRLEIPSIVRLDVP